MADINDKELDVINRQSLFLLRDLDPKIKQDFAKLDNAYPDRMMSEEERKVFDEKHIPLYAEALKNVSSETLMMQLAGVTGIPGSITNAELIEKEVERRIQEAAKGNKEILQDKYFESLLFFSANAQKQSNLFNTDHQSILENNEYIAEHRGKIKPEDIAVHHFNQTVRLNDVQLQAFEQYKNFHTSETQEQTRGNSTLDDVSNPTPENTTAREETADINDKNFLDYLESVNIKPEDYQNMTPMAAAAVYRGFMNQNADRNEEKNELSAAERDEQALNDILNDENYTEEEKELALDIAIESEKARNNPQPEETREQDNEFDLGQEDTDNEETREQDNEFDLGREDAENTHTPQRNREEHIWGTIPTLEVNPEDYGLTLDKALALVNEDKLNGLSKEELLAVHRLIAASAGNADALKKVKEVGRERLASFVANKDGFRIQDAAAYKAMINTFGADGMTGTGEGALVRMSEVGAKAHEKLTEQVRAYDLENELIDLTKEKNAEIGSGFEEIFEEIDKINIAEKPQDGREDIFAEARQVLESLDFRDEKGKPLSAEAANKLRQSLIEAAKLEAAKNLLPYRGVLSSATIQQEVLQELEVAVYNTVVMDKVNGAGNKNFPDKARAAVQAWAKLSEGSKIKVSEAAVQAQFAITYDRVQGYALRLEQRVGKNSALDRYAARIKAFDDRHKDNKNYNRAKTALKFIGSAVKGYGLYTVASMTAPVGMVALMGYNTVKAVKNIRKSYKASGEKNFWQYLKKNKVQVLAQSAGMLASAVGLGGAAADTVNTFGIQGGEILNQVMSNPAIQHIAQNRVVVGMTAGVAPKAANLISRLADVARGKATWKDVKNEFKDLTKTAAAIGAGFAINQGLGAIAADTGLTSILNGEQPEAENRDYNYDERLQKLGVSPEVYEHMTEAQKEQLIFSREIELGDQAVHQPLSEDQQRWDARNDKFLGAELKESIYDLVEKGEIKLPEGIESKEEFAYKYAMLRELAPVAQADAINNIETMLKGGELTPEQFQNIQTAMGYIADTGEYSGPGATTSHEQTTHHENGAHHQENNNENQQDREQNTSPEPKPNLDEQTIDNALGNLTPENAEALRNAVYQDCVAHGMSPEDAQIIAYKATQEFTSLHVQGKDFEAKELMHTLHKELTESDYNNKLQDFLHGDENDSNRVNRLQGQAQATNAAYHEAEAREAETRAALEAAEASGDRSAIIRAQESHGDALKDLAHLREDFIKDNVKLAEATYKNDIDTAKSDINRLEQLENKVDRLEGRIDNKEGRLHDINTPDADADKHEANRYERQTDRNLNKLERIERLEAKVQEAYREMAEINGTKITSETTVEDVLKANEAHRAQMQDQIAESESNLDRLKAGDYSKIPTLNEPQDTYNQSELHDVVNDTLVGEQQTSQNVLIENDKPEPEMTLQEQELPHPTNEAQENTEQNDVKQSQYEQTITENNTYEANNTSRDELAYQEDNQGQTYYGNGNFQINPDSNAQSMADDYSQTTGAASYSENPEPIVTPAAENSNAGTTPQPEEKIYNMTDSQGQKIGYNVSENGRVNIYGKNFSGHGELNQDIAENAAQQLKEGNMTQEEFNKINRHTYGTEAAQGGKLSQDALARLRNGEPLHQEETRPAAETKTNEQQPLQRGSTRGVRTGGGRD